MKTNLTDAEASLGSDGKWDYMNGWRASGGPLQHSWMFRRAPGFFDVVCYSGSGSATASNLKNHNLGVAPELVIIKARDLAASGGWPVYFGQGQSTMYFNTNAAAGSSNYFGYGESPTMNATQFSVGSIYDANNNPSYDYIAYLFASVSGICDIGSFTDTGSEADIDCGFSNGARFVMIKPSDSSGSWSFFDTDRGISNSSSPRLAFNTTGAQQGGTAIKPYSGGFRAALGTTITYIYMAIA
jgi:hypothetical protein